MKILALEITNFLTIGNASVKLDDRGLVLIQGENRDDTSQDSNGAGKSSVADAVSWGLFGVTARGESGDEVINNTVKRGGASVALELNDDGVFYRIMRTRLKGKGDLVVERLDGTDWVKLTRGTMKLTQSLVEKIIGCSADVFNAAIYAGQEKMPDLPGMTDKGLKLLIEEAAGILRLERAYKVAREKMNDAQKAIEAQARITEQAEYMCGVMSNTVDRVALEVDDWETTHKRDIVNAGVELKSNKTALDTVKARYDVVLVGEPAHQRTLQEINDRLASLDSYQRTFLEAKNEHHQARRELDRAEHELNSAVTDARSIKAQLESVEKIVGTPCKSCGKPHEEKDIETRRAKLRADLEDALNRVRTRKADKEGCERKLTVKLSDAEEAESAIPDTTTEIKRRDEVSAALSEIKNVKLNVEYATQRVRDTMQRLKDLKAQDNPRRKQLEYEKNSLKNARERLKTEQDKLAQLESDLVVRRAAAQVFGPAGVRAHILDTVTPFLNDRTSHYLSALTDSNIQAYWSTLETNSKGEIREKFAIAVTSKVGAHSFKGLSGGEKRKVRLACSMALQDLVSSRATKPIQLYIADEIDHALDEAGLERLMGILEGKASDRGTVLVISHNALSDWCSRFVTVVKEGGKSRIEGSALS